MKIRIISGELGSRLINIPQSDLIRPTTDRVRETLFNLLNNILDFNEIKVLDLYAGSGSLGIECISRGTKEVHFVENNLTIYKNLLKNIESLKIEQRCKVFKTEAVKFLSAFTHDKYDLVLADPPFFKDDVYETITNILSNNFLNQDGIIIVERSKQTIDKDIANFNAEPFKIIGDTCLYRLPKA
jgi:16S rRNA (guanine966-N2)-methyltransferase